MRCRCWGGTIRYNCPKPIWPCQGIFSSLPPPSLEAPCGDRGGFEQLAGCHNSTCAPDGAPPTTCASASEADRPKAPVRLMWTSPSRWCGFRHLNRMHEASYTGPGSVTLKKGELAPSPGARFDGPRRYTLRLMWALPSRWCGFRYLNRTHEAYRVKTGHCDIQKEGLVPSSVVRLDRSKAPVRLIWTSPSR